MEITAIASGSTGNAYLISDGASSLLLDCGIPYTRISQGCGYKLQQVAGCLLTHEHGDHSKAAQSLLGRGIDVYSSAGTFAALGIEQRRAHILRALETTTISSFRVMPFGIEHDAAEPFGYLIESTVTGERLLYATDTYYIRYRFPGITHLMIEANYDPEIMRENAERNESVAARQNRIYESHMSIDSVLEMLRAMDCSRLRVVWLIHMSRDNSDPEDFAERVRRQTGAEVYIA